MMRAEHKDRLRKVKGRGTTFRIPALLALILLLLVSSQLLSPCEREVRAQQLHELPPPPVMPPARPKERDEDQDVDEGDVISVSTSEVLLPVTVRNQQGQLVTALTRKDFRVFEEGREQPLSDLALRQVPVDVVLMIDTSSSVARNIEDFRRAVEGFAQRLAADDRISLIKFDDRIELLQDWTQSRVQLRRSCAASCPESLRALTMRCCWPHANSFRMPKDGTPSLSLQTASIADAVSPA